MPLLQHSAIVIPGSIPPAWKGFARFLPCAPLRRPMKTSPVTFADLQSSVIAVPPLCRNKDLSLSKSQNSKLIKHMHKGGIRTLLYGGNANLYNIAISEYHFLLKMLVDQETGNILGVHIIGYAATEQVHIGQLLIEGGFTIERLKNTVFNYPTYGELYHNAALDAWHKLEKVRRQ